MNLCGDPTCTNYGCTQEALDAWHQRQQDDARRIVRGALGAPADPPASGKGASE